MKRSEIVNKVANYLYNYGNYDSYADFILTSAQLMSFLEEEGMLPPETRNFRLPPDMNRYALADELAKYSVYGYSGPYYGMKYDINEWEPEDG